MYKKIILMTVMCVLLSTFAYAAIELPDPIVAYTLNDTEVSGGTTLDLSNQSHTLTNNGVLTGEPGFKAEGYVFDGVNDNLDSATTISNGSMTIMMWVQQGPGGSANPIYVSAIGGSQDYMLGSIGRDRVAFGWESGGASGDYWTSVDGTLDGTWTHLAYILTQGDVDLFINTTNTTISSIGAFGTGFYAQGGANGFNVGVRPDEAADFNGTLDNILIYPRRLNVTEIEFIMNETWPYATGGGGAPAANFTITAIDNVTSDAILIFNATVAGTDYTTTNGTITTDIVVTNTTLFNITVRSQNYTKEDYTNYNVSLSGALQADLRKWFYANTSFTASVLELEEQTILLAVNKSAQVDGLSAILNWNGTIYTPTITNFTNYSIFNATFTTTNVNTNVNVTFGWDLNLTRDDGQEEWVVNATQLVVPIAIDNCTTYATRAINFSIRNITNDALVTGSLGGFFNVWITEVGSFQSFNLSWGDSTTFGVCIDPNQGNFTFYSQMEYTAPNLPNFNYYFSNAIMDNITDQVNLYLTDGTTQITFTVTDENDNPVQGVLINVLQYDLTTNSSVTDQILTTDTQGQAIGNVVLNTQWYKFLLTLNGETVFESQPELLTAATRNFRINLQDDFFDTYTVVNGVVCTITFTNTTRNFVYVWNDPTGTTAQACLSITQRGAFGDTPLNTSCVSSSAGTIALSAGNQSGDFTYLGYGNITVNDNVFACGDVVSFSDNTTYKLYGVSGIFMSLIIILTLVSAGIWHPVAAVVLMTIGIIFTNMLGIFHLNWEILISFIILAFITIYRLSNRN